MFLIIADTRLFSRRIEIEEVYIYIFIHERVIVDGWFYTRAGIEYACRHAKFDVTLHRLSLFFSPSLYVYAFGDTRIVSY
jgi:hypothetical protein